MCFLFRSFASIFLIVCLFSMAGAENFSTKKDCKSKCSKNVIKDSKIFNGWWGGYFDSPTQTLDKTPSYVNVVTLAFAAPLNNQLSTVFLESKYNKILIIPWIKKLQKQGQIVLLSLLDTPSTHWNEVDLFAFAQSVKDIAIDEWGFDGIDIDAESDMNEDDFAPSFIELIFELKKAIGENKILTYTCYTGIYGPDNLILSSTKQFIDWINLMAYFYNLEEMKQLFNDYASIMGGNNVVIGVKAGEAFTSLPEVAALSAWNANKGGMMLWTLNRDNPNFTNQTAWTWTKTINNNLQQARSL